MKACHDRCSECKRLAKVFPKEEVERQTDLFDNSVECYSPRLTFEHINGGFIKSVQAGLAGNGDDFWDDTSQESEGRKERRKKEKADNAKGAFFFSIQNRDFFHR